MTITIPADRQQAIETAIATLEAQGQKVTNDAVLKIVGGRKSFINAQLQQWRAEHRASTPPADQRPVVRDPAPPAPPAAPPGTLRDLCTRRAAAEERSRELAQLLADHDLDLAHLRMEERAALAEARRLLPLFRQAWQAVQLGLYGANETVRADYQRLRTQLGALVGPEDVQAIENTPASKPWWLDAR